MTYDFTTSDTWQRTLAEQSNDRDDQAEARSRLRMSFLRLREKVDGLLNQIHVNLPMFTVHDLTHVDALWEMVDILIGKKYPINPCEAYVLGGAILLHDAAMSLAAYPNGLEQIKQQEPELWADTVSYYLRLNDMDASTQLDSPPENVQQLALKDILRELHAKQAEALPVQCWNNGKNQYFLIADEQIREDLGYSIGKIARSHWWTHDEIDGAFSSDVKGAPTFCPNEWQIDLLKLAGILRCADASHIDDRRAPSWEMALRELDGLSELHWLFQNSLLKPRVDNASNSLVYSPKQPFPIEHSEAWWICYDTISMIDRELRHTDTLLADRGRVRFLAQRVSNAESPERLALSIATKGWEPIDARIQVKNSSAIIEKLGGRQLYGKSKIIAVRELIQNATDAIVARRALQNKNSDWGEVSVRLNRDENNNWVLEVLDNGIGMSPNVIRDYLVDFGSSYWGSSLMKKEFPGMYAKELNPIGKYGIGFFSAFMIGEKIKVFTRRYNLGDAEGWVVEFSSGSGNRPVLSRSNLGELLPDGGTLVQIPLSHAPNDHENGIFGRNAKLTKNKDQKLSPLYEQLNYMFIQSPVTIVSEMTGFEKKVARIGNDWLNCPARELIIRTDKSFKMAYGSVFESGENRLRILYADNETAIGRAAIVMNNDITYGFMSGRPPDNNGVVTVGGIATESIPGIFGVIDGSPARVSRDQANIIAGPNSINNWATEQAELFFHENQSLYDQILFSAHVIMYGGDTRELAIAVTKRGAVDKLTLLLWLRERKEVYLTYSNNIVEAVDHLGENEVAFPIIDKSYTFNHLMKAADCNPFKLLSDSVSTTWNKKIDELFCLTRGPFSVGIKSFDDWKNVTTLERATAYLATNKPSKKFAFPVEDKSVKLSNLDEEEDDKGISFWVSR